MESRGGKACYVRVGGLRTRATSHLEAVAMGI
jgi:hypothetical protein